MRWTQNELALLKANRDKGVPPQYTARLLCRDENELTLKKEVQVGKTRSLMSLAPTLDLIWAYRYVHIVYKQSLITDEVYDALVQEEIEYGGGAAAFEAIKHHQGWPERIRSLGLYLVQREKEK